MEIVVCHACRGTHVEGEKEGNQAGIYMHLGHKNKCIPTSKKRHSMKV